MTAWIELFESNPAACLCLLIGLFGGTAAIVRAIRGEGQK